MQAALICIIAANGGVVGPFTGQGTLATLSLRVDDAPGFIRPSVQQLVTQYTYGTGWHATPELACTTWALSAGGATGTVGQPLPNWCRANRADGSYLNATSQNTQQVLAPVYPTISFRADNAPGFASAAPVSISFLADNARGFTAPTVLSVPFNAIGNVATPPPDTDPYFSNVELLAHFNGANGSTTLTDTSSHAHTITPVNGAALSTAAILQSGATLLLNGTNQYATTDAAALHFGAGDFTVEGWIRPTSLPSGEGTIISNFGGGGQRGFDILYDAGLKILLTRFSSDGSSSTNFITTTTPGQAGFFTIEPNSTHHIAVVRYGSAVKFFVDGVDRATLSPDNGGPGPAVFSGTIFSTTTPTYIGCTPDVSPVWFFPGYIDELRITKGIARYTSAFTPSITAFPNAGPPTTDPNFANVSLLLHMDGTNGAQTFTDSSSNARSPSAISGTVTSTTQKKFGTASAYYPSDQYIRYANYSGFDFGTGDLTIEFWMYTTNASTQQQILDLRPGTNTLGIIYIVSSSFRYYTNAADRINGGTPVSNQWMHVALSRVSGVTRLFIDGVQAGISYTDTQDLNGAQLSIGEDYASSAGFGFRGYIDDVRITKGIARYTANFTPSTTAFPNAGPPSTTLISSGFEFADGTTSFADGGSLGGTWTVGPQGSIVSTQLYEGTHSLRQAGGNCCTTPWVSGLDLGSSDFTIGVAARVNDGANGFGTYLLSAAGTGAGGDAWALKFGGGYPGNLQFVAYLDTGTVTLTYGGGVTGNAWADLTIVRSGTSLTLNINGTTVASATISGAFTARGGGHLVIGASNTAGSNATTAYFDKLRIIKS